MLGIHNHPNVVTPTISFKGDVSDIKRKIEDEGQEKRNQYKKDQADWDEFADNLENSDNKILKKGSKIFRIGAALFGIAATFVGAKVGSKVAIETLKTLGKEGSTARTVIDGAKKMKEPLVNTFKAIAGGVKKVAETPAVKELAQKLKASKLGTKISNVLKNEKVASALEPLKTTLKSVKDIKIDGKKIQSFVENTMAGVATGSVVVDDLAGRNNNKSNAELAAGV